MIAATSGRDRSHLPLGRTVNREEVGELVRFLVSDASSYVTGTESTVDGGSTAGQGGPAPVRARQGRDSRGRSGRSADQLSHLPL